MRNLCVVRLNDKERADWVNNYEELYRWWKMSGGSLRKFVRENRQRISEIITEQLDRKPIS